MLRDAAMLQEFREMLVQMEVKVDDAAWQGDLEFIRVMVRYEIDFDLFGAGEAKRRLLAVDPQVLYALTLFPEARRLADLEQSPVRQAQR